MTIVVLYRQDCDRSAKTLEVLDDRGLEYEKHDVRSNDAARRMMKALGYFQTPVVMVDNECWSGYWPNKLSAIPST